ncbi:MAG: FtsW/RodA/SpoVE family cell cycle protein, partial [Candidatus Neomarinimicrobiota bacterium]
MPLQVSSQKYDRSLLIIALLLVIFGTIMVFSSSTNLSMERFGTGTYYPKRHVMRALIGLTVMIGAMMLDFRVWKRLAPTLIFVSI